MSQEQSTLLTSQRDPANHFHPSPALTEARESGEWPLAYLKHPQYSEPFQMRSVTRYEEVRQVLTGDGIILGHTGENSPGSLAAQPGVLLYTNGAEHARLRTILRKSFTLRRVRELRPRITEIVDSLLNRMEASGRSADLFNDFALLIPTQVICELLGVPVEDRGTFQRWAPVIMDLNSTPEQAQGAIQELREYMTRLVERERRSPSDTLIGDIVLRQGDEIGDDELTGLMMFLFIAGHDTTANTITLSILALLDHPDQLAKVRDDESVLPTAIDELVRYTSPSASPPNRIATQPITIGDREVEPGERLIVSLLAANYDPALVGDEPGLDIERKRTSHVGFGYGEHQCPGQHLARLEMEIAIPSFLRRFPELRLTAEKSELPWRTHAQLYGVDAVPVEW